MKISIILDEQRRIENVKSKTSNKKGRIEKVDKMSNIIHPKLDPDIVDDFEEEDDDPIASLPFKVSAVNTSLLLLLMMMLMLLFLLLLLLFIC